MKQLLTEKTLPVVLALLLYYLPITTVYAFTTQSQAVLLTHQRYDSDARYFKGHSYLKAEDVPQEDNEDDENQSIGEEEGPIFSDATVKIDDGGSDLTDRFKYKVNALMGTYDPQNTELDNESQNGNILNAMLNFPTDYTFNIVGKTGGNGKDEEAYVDLVQQAVRLGSGITEMDYVATPRGKNFTKVQVTVKMESAAMINSVYQELANLEMTVMRF